MLSIPAKIIQAMQEAGLTYTALSERTGISKSALQRYATGETEKIPLDRLERIANALGLSVSHFTGWETNAPGQPFPEDFLVIEHLAHVSAGYSGTDQADILELVSVPRFMLKGYPPSECKMLTVKGDSMYPRYIDGDRIIYHAQTSVDSGSIAIVQYSGDEVTLKRVTYVSGEDWMELSPINPEYKPRRIEGADLQYCRIYGKVIGTIRTE